MKKFLFLIFFSLFSINLYSQNIELIYLQSNNPNEDIGILKDSFSNIENCSIKINNEDSYYKLIFGVCPAIRSDGTIFCYFTYYVLGLWIKVDSTYSENFIKETMYIYNTDYTVASTKNGAIFLMAKKISNDIIKLEKK